MDGRCLHLVVAVQQEVREHPVGVVVGALVGGRCAYVENRYRDRGGCGRSGQFGGVRGYPALVIPGWRHHGYDELEQVRVGVHRCLVRAVVGGTGVFGQSPEAVDTPGGHLFVGEVVARFGRVHQARDNLQQDRQVLAVRQQ